MYLLSCSKCGRGISAISSQCIHCGQKISFWIEVKHTIELNRLYQAFLAIMIIFVLGTAWYFGKYTGYRWPLFLVFILCAPLVPWILQLAYKNADQIHSKDKQIHSNGVQKEDCSDLSKIWEG